MQDDPIRELAHVATIYRRGIICPAELWRQIIRHHGHPA